MTKIKFGGIGVWIVNFKDKFELEVERIDGMIEAISDQTKKVATLQEDFSKFYLEKLYGFDGSLQKLADFGKRLTTCKGLISEIHEAIGTLETLQSECRAAQDRASAALPGFAMYLTEGRLAAVPGRKFFLASKNAGAASADAAPFALPAQNRSIDPTASLLDVALSRRFHT